MARAIHSHKLNAFPPGGWFFREPKTGWRTGGTGTDYATTVQAIMTHRKANPVLGISSDQATAEVDLQDFTAARLMSDAPGVAHEWVISGEFDVKKKSPSFSKRMAKAVGRVAKRVGNDIEGARVLFEWFGQGSRPVDLGAATRRAYCCSRCPRNDLKPRIFETTIANAIREQVGAKSDMRLETAYDPKIGTCDVCGCHLGLKIWVPLENISTDHPFPSNCWIVTENRISGRRPQMDHITVRRRAAHGDVLMASIVTRKLKEQGLKVQFQTGPEVKEMLSGSPSFDSWTDDQSIHHHIDLDGSYERSGERKIRSRTSIMIDTANRVGDKLGLKPLSHANLVPDIRLSDEEIGAMASRLGDLRGPKIAVVSRSFGWPNRAISPEALGLAAATFPGTPIWAMPWEPPTKAFAAPRPKSFRELMALISICDIVVTPDTGPLHVAAALNKPIVVLETANSTPLVLSNLTDWIAIHAKLDCIACGEWHCPIDREHPPCSNIPSALISAAVNRKWADYSDGSVSAVIPVLRWTERAALAVKRASEQCQQVVVALDGDQKTIPNLGPNVVIAPPTGTRIGYGRTVMRGIHASTHEFLLMLNDDCYLDTGCVAALKDQMTNNVGCVGCELRFPNGRIQHGGMMRDSNAVGFMHVDYNASLARIKNPVSMEAVTFACALLRRQALFAIRGFDEEFDTYCEDADLCIRLRQAGWGVRYTPHAKAVHEESKTTAPNKQKLHSDSAPHFLNKWRNYFRDQPALIQL